MSNSASSSSSPLKVFLGGLGVFVFFGFLALILSGDAGHESIEDRAYMGEFDAETIQQRWANLEEVETAQNELFDEGKVDAALAGLLKNAPKARKTEFVVPGSPTFMKQMEEASAPKEEAPAPEPEKPAPAADSAPAPENKPAAPAAEEKKPEPAKPAPKPEAAKEAPADSKSKDEAKAPKPAAESKPAQ